MDKLVEKLKEARLKLIQIVDDFPKEKRELVLFDKWSLKNLLSHLSGWAKYQIETLKQLKDGKEIELPKDLKNSINEDFVAQREKWNWDRVYLEFVELSEKLIKEYEGLPKKMWKNKIHKGKETTVEEFIKIEITHYSKTHGPQIKRVLKKVSV